MYYPFSEKKRGEGEREEREREERACTQAPALKYEACTILYLYLKTHYLCFNNHKEYRRNPVLRVKGTTVEYAAPAQVISNYLQ